MKKNFVKTPIKKGRLVFIFSVLLLVYLGLSGRLFYIMVFKSKEYKALATDQWVKKIEIAPKRGNILDRNGQVLALSSDVYRIDADLSLLQDTLSKKKRTIDSLTEDLTKILKLDSKELSKTLTAVDKNGKPLQFVSIKRRVEKGEADAVKALKLNGIIIAHDTKRFYPDGNFLSHVIGHTNSEGVGIAGAELSYNKQLTGMPGVKILERDMGFNELPYTEEYSVNPVDGKDLVLTIDEKIQQLCEKIAEEALKTNKAKSVSITVMDPKTGEVLAMVNKPDYNPNKPNEGAQSSEQIQEIWKNRALSNIFEPGSIFKVITAAAALETNSVKDGDKFKCEGSIKVADRVLYCDEGKAHGIETFSDIIKNSCNVGFIQLAQKIGKENFIKFAQTAGFGKTTGIDLPGESLGILTEAKNSTILNLSTMSYGHSLATTQVQYLAAFNAVANGGTWIKPHIMKQITHLEGNKRIVDSEFTDLNKKTILNSDNASLLRTYLERVVQEGTATAAFVEGYHIAGKTGTAVKVNPNGGYEYQKYVSSFAAMAPASNPVVTAIITIDEPDPLKYYAGETAVPAAKELFTKIFNYLPLK
jgi:stage V sporulation protein D (sporulation-specific penicillin-binding protein)